MVPAFLARNIAKGELAFDQHPNFLPSVKFRPIFLQQMQRKRAYNSIHPFASEQEEGRPPMFEQEEERPSLFDKAL